MSVLEVKNLSFTYGKGTAFYHDAIKNISFSLDEGEILGIIGHTGSGKSTVVQHLNGLIPTEKGHIFFQGRDIWENPKAIQNIRFKIGLVFQYPEYQLFDETVFKDIAYGPKNMGLKEAEVKQRVLKAVEMAGVDKTLLDKSPFDLSGGEKRRVAIAGIIAMEPEILVLDEPTAGLDPAGRERVLRFIKEYRDATGAAVIMVSHSMQDVAKTADKILVLNQGEVFAFDTVENVFHNAHGLESVGLDIPDITKIFLRLQANGVDLPTNVYTVEQAKTVLLEKMKGGGRFAE
ncbi:MAG: energy-coupling factor transporter ATPase [Clostridia bacterium]|nr:energy-coupling factor transporter ATPase [Clostridia bacterium]MBQ7289057.1 energy-coupling factor transporter ATPase [Clostridia bacterium]